MDYTMDQTTHSKITFLWGIADNVLRGASR